MQCNKTEENHVYLLLIHLHLICVHLNSVCSSGCWDEGSPDKSKEMFSLKYEGRRTEHFLLQSKMLHLHSLMGVTSKSMWNVCNVWDLPLLVEPSSRDCWTVGATGMFG